MKKSQVFRIIILLVAGIMLFSFIKNEEKASSLIESYDKGQMSISDYREYTQQVNRGASPFAFDANHSITIEIYRNKKRENILFTGGGILAVLLVSFIYVRIYENKNDPIKNLENLKLNKIISNSEYLEKIEHSKNVQNQKKILENKKREYKKLATELENLKEKGILTENEYQEKLIKIKEKTA